MKLFDSLMTLNKRLSQAPRLPWDDAGTWASLVRVEATHAFPEELRTIVSEVQMYIAVSPALQARCRRSIDGAWEIAVDHSLVYTLAQLSLAFALYLENRTNEALPRVVLAAKAYLEQASDTFVPLAAYYSEGIFERLDTRIQGIIGDCFDSQLRFVLCHELAHIVFDEQGTSEPQQDDTETEVAADRIAALAVGGFWSGDYDRGMHRLGFAAVLIGFLGLCQVIQANLGTNTLLFNDTDAVTRYCGAYVHAHHRYNSIEHGLGHTLSKWNAEEGTLKAGVEKCLLIKQVAINMYDHAFELIRLFPKKLADLPPELKSEARRNTEVTLQKFLAYLRR
jgi:hypothetical protein